jgi:hypothetical protein
MTRLSRRRLLFGLGAALAVPAWAREGGSEGIAFAGSRVRFAGLEQGRALLSEDDERMRATSPFQRRAVVGARDAVDMAAFRRWNGDAARAWSQKQQARWQLALARLAPAFAALRIPLPPQIWLIATSGQAP